MKKTAVIIAFTLILTLVSCGSTQPRKCNGSMGKRVPMGVL